MRSRTVRLVLFVLWYGGWVLAGIVILRSATPWGIGIRHDSLSYLTAAQSLSKAGCLCRVGSGLELKPLVHFGPVYPILLWAVTALTGDLLVSARWIASVLYGFNLAAWGVLVHVHTRRFWAGAIVSALLAVSLVLLQVHDAAMSEPLFLAILALALLAMTAYLTEGKRSALWLAAVAVAAAVLTRYAGGSLIVLGLAAVLFLRQAPWRDRWGDAARFGLGAVVPVALWLGRNAVVAGSATNRTLRWHPITIDDVRAFLRVVTAWFTGGQYSHWVEGAILLGTLVGIGALLWTNRKTGSGGSYPTAILGLLLVGLAASYPVYIGISRSVFDDSVPIDDRMFSPMYVALVALIGVLAAFAAGRRRGIWTLLPVMALLLVGLLPYTVERYREKFENMRDRGVLFASRAWHESDSVAWVRSLPEDALLYSNQALILQFLTGRPVYSIPERFDPVKGDAREDFEDQLARMRTDLQRPGTYLLIFDPAMPMTPDDLSEALKPGLTLERIMADGFVMASAAQGGAP